MMNGLRRRLIACLMVLICAGAEIIASVPRLHAHPVIAGTTAEENAGPCIAVPHHHDDRSDRRHGRDECLACRVFAQALTLTPRVTIVPSVPRALAAFTCDVLPISQAFRTAVRGRAPPAA